MLSLKTRNFRAFFYPVASGLFLAYLSASMINVLFHESTIRTASGGSGMQASELTPAVSTEKILERNVFGLKKGEAADAAAAEAGGDDGGSIKSYQLIGTVTGESRMALFKKDKDLIVLAEGASLDSTYRLEKVSFDSVTLASDGKRLVLRFPERKRTKGSLFPVHAATARTETPVVVPESSDARGEGPSDRIVIKRKEALSLARNLNKLLTTVRIAPFYRENEFVGYQLSMLKKDSFLYKLGLRRGDILKRINGEDVSSPQKAMELLSKIEDITAVNIDLMRRGEKRSLFIEIEE